MRNILAICLAFSVLGSSAFANTEVTQQNIADSVYVLPDDASVKEAMALIDQMSDAERLAFLSRVEQSSEYSRIARNIMTQKPRTVADLKVAAIAGEQTAFLGPAVVGVLVVFAAGVAWLTERVRYCDEFRKRHPMAPFCR
jgi:hypothetical protein